jgi:hypothetical protein
MHVYLRLRAKDKKGGSYDLPTKRHRGATKESNKPISSLLFDVMICCKLIQKETVLTLPPSPNY